MYNQKVPSMNHRPATKRDKGHSSSFWIVTFGTGYTAALAGVVCLELVRAGSLAPRTGDVLAAILGMYASLMGIMQSRKLGWHGLWAIEWVWGNIWLVGSSALILMLSGLVLMLQWMW
jgi:hypothetical protein